MRSEKCGVNRLQPFSVSENIGGQNYTSREKL